MNPAANPARACLCGEPGCSGNGGGYYVSLKRDRRLALLRGPFDTHAEALAHVSEAHRRASDVDPWAAFDAVGTVRMRDGYSLPGVLDKIDQHRTT